MTKLLAILLLLLYWSIPIKVKAELHFSEIYASPNINEHEWYELYNDSDEAINLSNFSLSREKAGKIYHQELLTATTATIAAHSYFVAVPEYSLPNAGGVLHLYNQNQELIDQLVYPALNSKQSYAYFHNLEPHWQITSQPTPKKDNQLAAPASNSLTASTSGTVSTKALPPASSRVAVINSQATSHPTCQQAISLPTNTPSCPHSSTSLDKTQPTVQKTTAQDISKTFNARLVLPQLEIVTPNTALRNKQQNISSDNNAQSVASASGTIKYTKNQHNYSFFLPAGIAVIISGIALLLYKHYLNTENDENDYNYLPKI